MRCWEIHVPAGSVHEPWSSNNAARMMQPTENTDMGFGGEIRTGHQPKLSGTRDLVQQDNGNYLRFDFFSIGTSIYVFAASITNSVATQRIFAPVSVTAPMYLRVNRLGDLWTMSYSDNGWVWNSAGSFTNVMNVTQVGVFAGNYPSGGVTPAHTTKVDYFFDTDTSIIPEDGVPNIPPEVAIPIHDVLLLPRNAAANYTGDAEHIYRSGLGGNVTLSVASNTNSSLRRNSACWYILGAELGLSQWHGRYYRASYRRRQLILPKTLFASVQPPRPTCD
ncbi:MAG: hypothetical protein R3C28_26380 [Pirellulaceae bacterium]